MSKLSLGSKVLNKTGELAYRFYGSFDLLIAPRVSKIML